MYINVQKKGGIANCTRSKKNLNNMSRGESEKGLKIKQRNT